jgi:hypothetical protein
MNATYRAIEVPRPGEFSEVRKSLHDPGPNQVRIRVEACGVCHSDSATIDGIFPRITYPRVPGHEVIGRIDALGSGVQGWALGQRVGVGFLGGSCGYCEFCRGGDLVNCKNPSCWRICRGDDREGERARVDPRRPLVRRRGAAALRGNHNVQRPAKRFQRPCSRYAVDAPAACLFRRIRDVDLLNVWRGRICGNGALLRQVRL